MAGLSGLLGEQYSIIAAKASFRDPLISEQIVEFFDLTLETLQIFLRATGDDIEGG